MTSLFLFAKQMHKHVRLAVPTCNHIVPSVAHRTPTSHHRSESHSEATAKLVGSHMKRGLQRTGGGERDGDDHVVANVPTQQSATLMSIHHLRIANNGSSNSSEATLARVAKAFAANPLIENTLC